MSEHGIIKCSKEDFNTIDKEDVISARKSEFGVEALVRDRRKCEDKYAGIVMDRASLEDIMLYYVKRNSDSVKER